MYFRPTRRFELRATQALGRAWRAPLRICVKASYSSTLRVPSFMGKFSWDDRQPETAHLLVHAMRHDTRRGGSGQEMAEHLRGHQKRAEVSSIG
jgi:hypothetical protein